MPHPLGVVSSDPDHDLRMLAAFRDQLYRCFGRWADTLFELVDALAGTTRPIRSVAELMFEPVLRRGWGSRTRRCNVVWWTWRRRGGCWPGTCARLRS